MAKPIYAGTYQNRGGGRWKNVFIVIILIQILIVVIYLITSRGKKAEVETPVEQTPAAPAPAPLDLAPTAPFVQTETSPETKATLADAQAAIDGGQLADAKIMLDKLVASTPDAEAIKMLGDLNIRLLKSPMMIPGKEYYAIQSGDYLQKIAKNYNITVPLIKQMNGLETDVIRSGARLLVYNGNFSIRVSKSGNTLDLMAGKQLFKRYSVGTGKFGKTPSIEFTVVDKIVEPPWTRPADNKQIEYGDPENVLGTRWMKIVSNDHPEITGFGIHGTWERDSIGKQSSAGCIRMLNEDVEELFDLIPRKTPVTITE
ncbi:MAG: L,D-transpeptidase family protein [Pontiella sp.]|nr:L,D-transpeptidase family protein [Pontiella sp.]